MGIEFASNGMLAFISTPEKKKDKRRAPLDLSQGITVNRLVHGLFHKGASPKYTKEAVLGGRSKHFYKQVICHFVMASMRKCNYSVMRWQS